MTSHFDNLMRIGDRVFNDATAEKFKPALPLIGWLAKECIRQADSREPKTWTYAKYLAKGNAHRKEINETVEARKNDPLPMIPEDSLWAMFEFLNDCHDVLDHKNWHLKVFDAPLAMLIAYLEESLCEGRDFSGYYLKRNGILKTYPNAEELLVQAGFTKRPVGKGKFDFYYDPPVYARKSD